MIKEKYVTVTEAAEIMGKSISVVRNLCLQGRLEGAEKLGTAGWIVPRESALHYKSSPRGPKPGTQTKKAKLAAERAAILEQAKRTMEMSA